MSANAGLALALALCSPAAAACPATARPAVNQLAIGPSGRLRWNGCPVGHAQLRQLFAAAAALDGPGQPPPELRIRASRQTAYGQVEAILKEAQAAGLGRVAFVEKPGR